LYLSLYRLKNDNPGHLLYIDGLRAVAAIYVVMHHASYQFYPNEYGSLKGLQRVSMTAFSLGHYAVDLFIVLSGFCLMLPVLNNDFRLRGGVLHFLKRRAIRILPPYYFALIVSLALIYFCIGDKTGSHWDVSIPVTTNDIVAHVFLIQDFFKSTNYKINHSLWSVSLESHIYLLFPLILLSWRKFGAAVSLFLAILLSALIFISESYGVKFYPDLNADWVGVSPFIILFILGMIAAKLTFADGKTRTIVNRLPWWLFFIVMVVITVATKPVMLRYPVMSIYLRDVETGIASLFFLMACTNVRMINRFFSWKPLVFLGTFSYSIYLLHAPLLQVLYKLIVPLRLSQYASSVLITTIGSLLCIAISYPFFIVCEKPFLNLGKKRTIKQTEINAVIDPAP